MVAFEKNQADTPRKTKNTLRSVDFPQPLIPTSPSFCPLQTVSWRSSNWKRAPSKVLLRPSAIKTCGVPVTTCFPGLHPAGTRSER